MTTKPDEITLNVFGKILYALAMADGEVQQEELDELEKIVQEDEWAREIKLSFDSAMELEMDPQIVFFKNVRIFQTLSKDEHMPYFLDLMRRIAEAYDGIVPEEHDLILKFSGRVPGEYLVEMD